MKTLLAPDIVTHLSDKQVYVFPSSCMGPKVRGNAAVVSLKSMGYLIDDIPRIGANGSLYAIRIYKTPLRGDLFDNIDTEIDSFLQFAHLHSDYLFIMSRDGWTKGGRSHIPNLDKFIESAAQIGNIAIPEKLYALSRVSMLTERVEI